MNSTHKTDHLYTQVFTAQGWAAPAWPLLLLTFVFFGVKVLGYFLNKGYNEIVKDRFPKFMVNPDELEVEQNLGDFFSTLTEKDHKWSIEEEKNNRELNLKMIPDPIFERLKASESIEKKNTLMGTHSYDILCNPIYATAFQYISNDNDDRNMLIVDGDDDETNDNAQCNKTRVFLNLAYYNLTVDRADFKFKNDDFNTNT